jgi:hypothetical protein
MPEPVNVLLSWCRSLGRRLAAAIPVLALVGGWAVSGAIADTVVTRDGQRFEGTIVSQTSWGITLVDASGSAHPFFLDEVQRLTRGPEPTPTPRPRPRPRANSASLWMSTRPPGHSRRPR